MSAEKRAILAAVLMAAVLLISQYLFAPPPEPARPSKPEPQATKPAPVAPPAPPPAPAPGATPRRPVAAPQPPQRLATVETPLYRAVVSSAGGKLQDLTLKYRGEKPMVIVGDLGPAGLLVGSEPSQVEPVPMELSTESLTLGPDRAKQDLVLTGETGGLRVRQTLTFDAGTYAIESRIRIENRTGGVRPFAVALPWVTRQTWNEAKPKFGGQHPDQIAWQTEDGHVEGIARSEHWRETFCNARSAVVKGPWVSMGSAYYVAALIQRSGGFEIRAATEDAKACSAPATQPAGRAVIELRTAQQLGPGETWDGYVVTYAGPKEYERLRALALVGTIDFGGFPFFRALGMPSADWLGIPLLLLLKWLYGFVRNYGVVIILLTVVTRVLFYPLTVKSMKSMRAMQALQPQINTLRNKYKNDPQRLQRETMELYRANKVNPLGGCLPMLAQVPIFYALYLALSVSVELQNAAFLCFGRVFGVDVWICDLASHDPTYVLPILMGITTFLQQKMTPVAGDPRQARIMLIVMPIFLTGMFINLPSGLVLYWTVSNVLQVVQQKYMNLGRGAPKEARA